MKTVTSDSTGAYQMFKDGKLENGEIFEIRFKRMNGYGVFVQGQLYSRVVAFGGHEFAKGLQNCRMQIENLIKSRLPSPSDDKVSEPQ